MIGYIENNTIIGTLNTGISLTGNMSSVNNITSTLNLDVGQHTDYDGDYEITPKTESQILLTKNKILRNNMQINEIPYYETGNEYGKTIYIGSEVDIYGN